MTEAPERPDLPAAVTVKPLEWDGRKTTDVMLQYRVHIGYGNMNGIFALTLSGSTIGEYHSEESAKAAAQADYERRILSCLTTQPDPVADAAQWRPIETAPKDGTEILGAWHYGGWSYEAVVWRNGWVKKFNASRLLPVTHWMPLAAPPRALAEQEQSE